MLDFFFPIYPTDLPDSSVHAVIAAQSFHWFANDKSISQIQRVLVLGGKIGLIWYDRDHSEPWVKEVDDEIILPCYRETNTPHQSTCGWKKVLDSSGKFWPLEGNESQFTSEQVFTWDQLIDRLMSVSVIQVKSDSEKEMVKEKIKLILNKHNELDGNNKIVLPYIVRIFWAERK